MTTFSLRFRSAVGAAAALTVAAGVVGTLPARASVPRTTPAASTSIHLTATPVTYVPIDRRPKGDSAGDEALDVLSLRDADTHAKVGSLVQTCILVRPRLGVAQCSGTLLLGAGELEIAYATTGSEVTVASVVGGTGDYARASGQATFTPAGKRVDVLVDLGGAS